MIRNSVLGGVALTCFVIGGLVGSWSIGFEVIGIGLVLYLVSQLQEYRKIAIFAVAVFLLAYHGQGVVSWIIGSDPGVISAYKDRKTDTSLMAEEEIRPEALNARQTLSKECNRIEVLETNVLNDQMRSTTSFDSLDQYYKKIEAIKEKRGKCEQYAQHGTEKGLFDNLSLPAISSIKSPVTMIDEGIPVGGVIFLGACIGAVLLVLLIGLLQKGGAAGWVVVLCLVAALLFHFGVVRVGDQKVAMMPVASEMSKAEFEAVASSARQWALVPVSFSMAPHSHVGEFDLKRLRLTLEDAKVMSDDYLFVAYDADGRTAYAGRSHNLPESASRLYLNNDSDLPAQVTLVFEKY